MKSWDMNKIISCGLVFMGIIAVVGWIMLSYKTGTSSGTEIPIAIVSGLVGVLTGQKLQEMKQNSQIAPQSPTAQTLGQVSEVASQAQAIANAVDALANLGKKDKQTKGQSGESSAEK